MTVMVVMSLMALMAIPHIETGFIHEGNAVKSE
jgi:Tfp pilus assembly protein FimT